MASHSGAASLHLRDKEQQKLHQGGDVSTGSQERDMLEHTIQQLTRENAELRNRCLFLDNSQQRSKHQALEWQTFGKYTAKVLKNEVQTAEHKIKLLKEQVEKLTKENKELKDMCLYLDQTQGSSDSKLTPPEITEILIHSGILSKLSSHKNIDAQLSGSMERGGGGDKDKEMAEALKEMSKMVDKLESEKLELIKSLSAAHMLVANIHSSTTSRPSTFSSQGGAQSNVEIPPKLNTLLQRGVNSSLSDEIDGGPGNQVERKEIEEDIPLEVISNAVTLLELIQRLNAAEINGFTDPIEEAEVATLRVLISVDCLAKNSRANISQLETFLSHSGSRV